MKLDEYYEEFGSGISQDSERLFVDDFLYPLLGDNIGFVKPQYPFLDSTGRTRRIDFVCQGEKFKLALEVNGETYHAEGIIPNEVFDDNLFRQNEILRSGYKLVRYSYSQLKDPKWRPIVNATLRDAIAEAAPELLVDYEVTPNGIQEEALDALDFYRKAKGWNKAVVVMPTGTGKTFLSALDIKRFGGRALFLVHRLDILAQSLTAFQTVWPTLKHGYLTGEVKENELECDVLFASKDTLRQPKELAKFAADHFDYIVVDEVHHGQSPTYLSILDHFKPKFMLGMTATPDRLDRKDIFELFDYNKAYEVPVHEVIDRGFLVPYSYFGLTDNIDYSKIRLNGDRYKVEDLERHLIVKERNEAILKEYLEKGNQDKAIGFCVSIKHAERMAEFFNENGVNSVAIHSERPDKADLIEQFRDNKITVAFTVDLFNEGVDFPNVQVLLFLRPTESKTVFVQQLGRGLRMATAKKRVKVLDFIGNYKRAGKIRDYLSKGKTVTEYLDENGRKKRKIEYEYSTGCEVVFDESVEEILDAQDREELGVGKVELTDAYLELVEELSRKVSRNDIDERGRYKSAKYSQVFGSWTKFLQEIGAYTEASYHYPQGTHIGHILSIVWYFGLKDRTDTHLDDKFIRMRGSLGEGRISVYRRQLKYKLQAAMELGLLEDDRRTAADEEYEPRLTALGMKFRDAIQKEAENLDLSFPVEEDGFPSSRMVENKSVYRDAVGKVVEAGGLAADTVFEVFFAMEAVKQMSAFLFQVVREEVVERSFIYENFFLAPFVKQFMDQEGIAQASEEASKRRCPFLLDMLHALKIIETDRSEVTLVSVPISKYLVRPFAREENTFTLQRLDAIAKAWPHGIAKLKPDDISVVRELFGNDFMTPDYIFQSATIIRNTE